MKPTIAQTFRRIGDQLKGLEAALVNQDHQQEILKEIYTNNGLELVLTCSACPEQYEVFKDGKQVGYYRLRFGEFRVDFPDCGGDTIYTAEPIGDGMFEDSERPKYLIKAMRCVLERLSNPPCPMLRVKKKEG